MTTQERPLSPHLQIYKPQLTSMLSILHRATGFALAAGTLLIVAHLVAAVMGAETYQSLQDLERTLIGRIIVFGFAYSLIYHMLNGVRHLVWDAGYNLQIKKAYASGYLVLLTSIALTAWLYWVTCNCGGAP